MNFKHLGTPTCCHTRCHKSIDAAGSSAFNNPRLILLRHDVMETVEQNLGSGEAYAFSHLMARATLPDMT